MAFPCRALRGRSWNGDGSARTRARRLGDRRCSRGVLALAIGAVGAAGARRVCVGVLGGSGWSGRMPTSRP
jgi:hypothetical protein